MSRLINRSATSLLAACAFLFVLPAADGGCGNDDVVIGDDGGGGTTSANATATTSGNPTGGGVQCYIGGCSSQICSSDPNAASTCEWLPEYQCYQDHGICEADANGVCDWRPTSDLQMCLDNINNCTDPNDPICACQAGGGTWTSFPNTCVDACGAGPNCGAAITDGCDCGPNACWDGTTCVDSRMPVNEACIRSTNDACQTDADCVSGGCGGEVCYNPAVSGGASTCDCGPPSIGCGCVNGSCTWYQ